MKTAKISKKPKKTASKKPAAKTTVAKTTVAKKPKTSTAPTPPTTAPATTPAPSVPAATSTAFEDVPGEAVPGAHLAKCLRYVLAAVPKEDAEVTFDVDALGCPTISGHDRRRVHIAYLPEKAACALTGRVPRDEAADLADILEGARGPRVRISASGRVTIAHGVMQPEIAFRFSPKSLLKGVAIPSQDGRTRAQVPLRINTAHLAKAVKWANAVTTEFQASDGIAFLTVADIETGTMLARAIIAEDGLDIFPEDERQAELPGSRTAGRVSADVARAVDNLKASVPAGMSLSVSAGGAPPVVVVDKTTTDDEITIEGDGEPVEAPRAWPEPDTKPVVVLMPEAIWDGLSPEAIDQLGLVGGARVPWFTGADGAASGSLTADQARAVGAVATALGLVCTDVVAGRRYGIECSLWTAGRASDAKGGA